jgi:hypothetical protein
LTLWVGHALRKHGDVFLVDVFQGDTRLAGAVNQLLVISFYLLNFGYLMYFMATTKVVEHGRQVMELLSTKVGVVALVVGAVHIANVWCLHAFRRRALLRAAGRPLVAPNGRTRVAEPAAPWA